MANPNALMFKWGTQAKLDSIKANGGTHGTFYLTEDSHRLYIGLENNKIVPINDSIVKVANIAALPTTGPYGNAEIGTFYYAQAENVLCVYNGTTWIQINPDTNTLIKENTIEGTAASNVATVTTTIKEKTNKYGSSSDGATYNTSFKLAGSDGVNITATTGADKIPVITIAVDDSRVSYTLSSSAVSSNTTTLTLDGPVDSTVKIKGGTNVTLTGGGTSDITIAAKDTTNSSLTIGNGSSTTDTNTNKEGFHVAVKDSSNKTVQAALNPVIVYGNNNTEVKFVNGKADLDVYTISEIDNKLQAVNAMVYKGTVDNATNKVPTTGVSVGDTYKASADFTLTVTYSDNSTETITVNQGDLLIANLYGSATENNGIIPEKSIKWDLVPSGDDTDTTYQFKAITNGTSLYNNVTKATQGSFAVAAGTDINVSDSAADGEQANTVTVKHANITSTNNSATPTNGGTQGAAGLDTATKTIKVVSGVTVSATGHVTDVAYTEHTFKDTNGELTANSDAVSASGNVATVKNTTTFKKSGGATTSKEATHTIEVTGSDNLKVAANTGGTGVVMSMVWGTF